MNIIVLSSCQLEPNMNITYNHTTCICNTYNKNNPTSVESTSCHSEYTIITYNINIENIENINNTHYIIIIITIITTLM